MKKLTRALKRLVASDCNAMEGVSAEKAVTSSPGFTELEVFLSFPFKLPSSLLLLAQRFHCSLVSHSIACCPLHLPS